MNISKTIKNIREYRRDPIRYIENLFYNDGHRSVLKIFNKKLFLLSDPKDVLHVLKENHVNYSKGRTFKVLRKILGNGLITSEGEFWRKQHRMIRPLMNPKSVYELFGPKMLETTLEFFQLLDENVVIDVFAEMNKLTWRIVLQTLFSQRSTLEMDSWLKDVLIIMEATTKRTRALIPLPFWIPIKRHRKLHKALNTLDHYIYGLINKRRNGKKKKDLIQLLIDAQDEGLSQMSESEIRDEIITFLMAGHETVTNTLTWTLICLAQNSQYLLHLREEADEFFKDRDLEKLNAMPWTSAVLDEVMRIWPPVWVIMREAMNDDKLRDLFVPAKSNVVVVPFITHRSHLIWERPLEFYPERFLPGERKKIPQGAFYPFGLGPRACIGAYFAGVETKIILATIVHNYSWSIVSEAKQIFEAGITLRPLNNIMMNFRKR